MKHHRFKHYLDLWWDLFMITLHKLSPLFFIVYLYFVPHHHPPPRPHHVPFTFLEPHHPPQNASDLFFLFSSPCNFIICVKWQGGEFHEYRVLLNLQRVPCLDFLDPQTAEHAPEAVRLIYNYRGFQKPNYLTVRYDWRMATTRCLRKKVFSCFFEETKWWSQNLFLEVINIDADIADIDPRHLKSSSHTW